jgi:hypothetical protein
MHQTIPRLHHDAKVGLFVPAASQTQNVVAAAEPAREWSRGNAREIDGQIERSNGAFGKSDIEGKAVMVAASELGSERVSNERERMSQNFRSVSRKVPRCSVFPGESRSDLTNM